MKGGAPVAAAAAAPAPAAEEAPAAEAAPDTRPVAEVWVFCEHTDSRPANVSWELLGKGKELAKDLDGRVCSVVLGKGTEALVKEAEILHGRKCDHIAQTPIYQERRPILQTEYSFPQTNHRRNSQSLGQDRSGEADLPQCKSEHHTLINRSSLRRRKVHTTMEAMITR
jgi:hypothetical protein